MFRLESSSKVVIEDLGLTLQAHLPVRITPEQKESSLCLSQLVRMGQVRLSWEEEKPEREARAEPPAPAIPLGKTKRERVPEEGVSLRVAQEIADRAARKAFPEGLVKEISSLSDQLKAVTEELKALKKSLPSEASIEKAVLKALKKAEPAKTAE
jgi:hypothetical protein